MQVSRTNEPLEAFADCAGRALACAFSSSDEYEAALIAERRAEGRYGQRVGRKTVLICGIGAAVLALTLILV